MKLFVGLFLIIGSVFLSVSAIAQLSEAGQPLSFEVEDMPLAFHEIQVQSPDLSTLIKEDKKRANLFEPSRFAKLIPVKFQPTNSGTWHELANGKKVWRLGIHLEGSLGISLFFTDFNLPTGASLFVYTPEGEQLLGAFTSKNNRPSGLFATELIYGDQLVVELNLEDGLEILPEFTIAEISFAYTDVYDYSALRGFGGSDPCEINVNCSPEGDNWQDEKRGVTRIQVKVGGVLLWCSGSLLDNVRHDHIPYILSADHCAYRFGSYATAEDLENWVFYFNYEASGCENPSQEPVHQSLTGAVLVASDGTHGTSGSDFYLIQLLDNIPYNYPHYFNGWSAIDFASNSGVTIHHPDGDIKKISTYTSTLETSGWQSNGLPSHWEVFWTETENNWGVTEGGSSGCPIFDNSGYVIGTLTGGFASCTNQDVADFYGKFSYHWDLNSNEPSRQLKPWLDPDNTGVTVLSGSVMDVDKHFESVNDRISLFPNPVNNTLNLRFHDQSLIAERVIILDVYGNIIFAEKANNRIQLTINVTDLESGVYFVKIFEINRTIVKKFVKR